MAIPVAPHDGDLRLAAWRAGVGPPVLAPAAANGHVPAAPDGHALLVVTWNLWIGRGRIPTVIARARALAAAPGRAEPPLVLLVQEAYRHGDAVPAQGPGVVGASDFSRRAFPEHDITAVARELQLHLLYAPSMRNGAHRSDRGSAILSSLPLGRPAAWELPFSYQRRVAVAATVEIGGRALQIASAHLDPRGGSARDFLGVLGRGLQASALARGLLAYGSGHPKPMLLGADLNLARGRRERAWRVLVEAGFRHGVPEDEPAWRHTYHRTPRLLLDWLLARDPTRALARMDVRRVDEHPSDRGPYVFDSDHHPLFALVRLAPAAEEAS
jgi:endonuclease/exonuclease/phosphatase family metal-dependent hydrolase